MSITSQMLDEQKLDAVITVSFPEGGPKEFELEFERLSYAEESFAYEKALASDGALSGGEIKTQAFAMAFQSEFFRILEHKLKGWTHKPKGKQKEFEFNDENKALFFRSLDFAHKQALVNAYQGKVKELREKVRGNGSMLAKDS